MKQVYRISCVAAALILMASVAMPQVRTKPEDKARPAGSSATPAVTGTGTPGQLVKWAGSDGTVLGNSIVTETKLGNIGIGTATPSSKLSVQGMIETTLGGYKFPDGTVQTTAVSGKVAHDETLAGDGTVAVPLRLRLPLFLSASVNGTQALSVLSVENTAPGIGAFDAFGGDAGPELPGGHGLSANGGRGIKDAGGDGLVGFGGLGADHIGGNGASLFGGDTERESGGNGVFVLGGAGSGAGHRGGAGIVAIGGDSFDNAKPGLAGDFQGDVSITGNLSKGGGSFKIDHPLDPQNKYLYHSFVESPDMKNIYDGTVTTDANGEATVTMPDWFEALNQDFRYQLTVMDTFAQAIVVQRIKGNRFAIRTSAPNIEVCWQVTGTRHDAYANKHRIVVEEDKPANERGLFLHPDAFNQPADKGVQFVKNAGRLKSARENVRHP